ncbi:DUF5654 family protein [Patescibacteria group bacterium]
MEKIKHITKQTKELRKEFQKQILNLVTGSFGLIAALAWNEVIKELIDNYIKPLVGGSSGIISLLIYAVIITLLTVLITYNLTRIIKKN